MPSRKQAIKIQPECYYGDVFGRDKYVRQRYQKYQELLKPYLQPGVKVLDIGGYRGDLKLFLPSNIQYFVLDFDEKALEKAKRRNAKVKKMNFDEEKISWDGEKFDIIVAAEVLEHLKDPARHVLEIKKILKKNGVFLASLPNENMLYHRLMSFLGFGVDYCAFKLYKHLHLPTLAQSRNFLETQFKIVKEDYYINVSAQASRVEFLGKIFDLIPDFVWNFLGHLWPSGFARGGIYLCKKIEKI